MYPTANANNNSNNNSIAEMAAMQQLAQLVIGLRGELREANLAKDELEVRLLKLIEECNTKQQEQEPPPSGGGSSVVVVPHEDDKARQLEEENIVLKADINAFVAELDDLRKELEENIHEKKMLNDVIARLKKEMNAIPPPPPAVDMTSDVTTLKDALQSLQDALTVSDNEMQQIKMTLEEKEKSITAITATQRETQYEHRRSMETVASLNGKITFLDAKRSSLEEELHAKSLAFLELKEENSDALTTIAVLEEKLATATKENVALTKQMAELITTNNSMKEDIKKLGESLSTLMTTKPLSKMTIPSSSSTAAISSSDDPMISCDNLISELRSKIKEIVSSRNEALEQIAILRSDASCCTGPADPVVAQVVNPKAAVVQKDTITIVPQVQKTLPMKSLPPKPLPSKQLPSNPLPESSKSIKSDQDSDQPSDEKTTANSHNSSISGSRGSNLLEAAKKLNIKLDDLKLSSKDSNNNKRLLSSSLMPSLPLSEAHTKTDPKATALPDVEQVRHVVFDNDDDEVSAKEIKEVCANELVGKSSSDGGGGGGVKSPTMSLTPPTNPKQEKMKIISKPKFDIDQLTSVYFEKSGMSLSRFSDLSGSLSSSLDSSSPPKPHNNNSSGGTTIAKKVKICRNGIFMGTYEGDLNKDGQRHGVGVLLCDNGNCYEGEWKLDKRDGLGVARYSSGDVYDGQWKRGRRQGHGVMYIESGDTYIGSWHNGLKHGAGTYHWADGEVDVSWYQEDKRVGEGVRWNANRDKAFRMLRKTKMEELLLNEAYARAERLGFNLEKFNLGWSSHESLDRS
jgi:hypothetical protein